MVRIFVLLLLVYSKKYQGRNLPNYVNAINIGFWGIELGERDTQCLALLLNVSGCVTVDTDPNGVAISTWPLE